MGGTEPVFATLFCAFAWSRALPERVSGPLGQFLTPNRQTLCALICGAATIPLIWLAVDGARDNVRSTRDYLRYRNASLWLAQNTPPGARVFATDWDDFPEMFFWNTHNTYLIGLDPTYMYLHNGPLYLQWRAITRGQVEMPSAVVPEGVRQRLGLYRPGSRRVHQTHQADPDMTEVYRDRAVVIFAVRGWQPRT